MLTGDAIRIKKEKAEHKKLLKRKKEKTDIFGTEKKTKSQQKKKGK